MAEDKTETAWQKLLYASSLIVLKNKTNKKARLAPYNKKRFTLILQCKHKKLIFHLSQGSIITPFLWGGGNKKLLTILGISKKGSTSAGWEKGKKKKYVQLCQMNCWVMVSELRWWKLLERKDTKWKWQKQFDEVVRSS